MSARSICKFADLLTCSICSQVIEWIGKRKCAPIPERTTFGANASVVSGGRRTACTPVAAAERSSVPRFPGSRIWSGMRIKLGELGIGNWVSSRTARIPCGVSVSLRDFIKLSETTSTSTPRDFRLSTCDLPLSLSASSNNANRNFQWLLNCFLHQPYTLHHERARFAAFLCPSQKGADQFDL